MKAVKAIYRRLIPLSWRKSVCQAYWIFVSLFADYRPKEAFIQDYETYWKSREDNNIWGLSYQELVSLCAREICEKDRVLDFGCGTGELLSELKSMSDICEVGIDISVLATEQARQRGVNAVSFYLQKEEDLLQLGHFNVAIATEVLEHIQTAEMVLIALSRVADKVLVSIPNTGYFAYRLRLLAGRFPRQWIIHPAEHVRFWTLADFRVTVQVTGYQIIKVCGIAGGRLGRWWPSLFAPDLFFVLRPS